MASGKKKLADTNKHPIEGLNDRGEDDRHAWPAGVRVGDGTPGPGRPAAYSDELAEEILIRMAEGQSLRSICRDEHLPCESTVYKWVVEDVAGFSEKFRRAREAQGQALGQRVIEVAERVERGELDFKQGRVAMEGFQWTASRLARSTYGHFQEVAVTQHVRRDHNVELTEETIKTLQELSGHAEPAEEQTSERPALPEPDHGPDGRDGS